MDAAVRVGPAGWSYEDWKGIVYPEGTRAHPLAQLSALFDAVEVNASFYRPLTAKMTARWPEHVAENPRFRFTAKLWRRFTHEIDGEPDAAALAGFLEGFAPLEERGLFGALLVQFPWSFRRTVENRQYLARLLELLGSRPVVVEIRHASWNRPEVFEAMAARGAAFCNIDQPLFRDSLAPTENVTAPLAYVRLHGRNAEDWFRESAGRDERYDYLYSEEELQPWVEKIARMQMTAPEVYVVTNNHFRGQAVVNALEIQKALGRSVSAVPPTLLEHYPRLARLLA